jgi:hypothetical protein
MKFAYILLLTLLSFSIFAQNEDAIHADSLSQVKLEYELLDSSSVRRKLACRIPDKFSFNKQGDYVTLIYRKKDRNLWFVIYLPFTATSSINGSLINLDYRGESELIIEGEILEYAGGGGMGKKCMMIVNFDKEPTQLFNVFYGCKEESFGNNLDGEGAYYNVYERKITIASNVISIEPINETLLTDFDFANCSLTQIPAGNYVMKKGKIVKR